MSTVGQQPLRWSHESDVASFGLGPPFRLNTHAHTRAYAHAHTQHAYLMPELWHICAALNLLPFDSEAGALIKPSQIRLFKLTSPILARGTPPVPPPPSPPREATGRVTSLSLRLKLTAKTLNLVLTLR